MVEVFAPAVALGCAQYGQTAGPRYSPTRLVERLGRLDSSSYMLQRPCPTCQPVCPMLQCLGQCVSHGRATRPPRLRRAAGLQEGSRGRPLVQLDAGLQVLIEIFSNESLGLIEPWPNHFKACEVRRGGSDPAGFATVLDDYFLSGSSKINGLTRAELGNRLIPGGFAIAIARCVCAHDTHNLHHARVSSVVLPYVGSASAVFSLKVPSSSSFSLTGTMYAMIVRPR